MSEGGETYEDFWGCTLAKGKNEAVWAPLETEVDIEHKLQLTSACLGVKAKDGERNLVEVTTANDDGDEVVCSIVSLRAGGNECMHLELGFNNPTKFKLREGSGPLSLCGTHLKAAPLDMMDDEDFSDEDDEDIPNLVEPKIKAPAPKPVTEKKKEPAPKTKQPTKTEKKTDDKPAKRPLEDKKDKQAPSKKKKVEPEPEPEESEEEESEDEEEEESGEEVEGSDEDDEMPSLLDGEAVEDDDEESEDEDEPEEGDDVESDEEEEGGSDEEGSEEEDEEDEDEDEEEEESEEEKTPAKKPLTNGHAKKTPSKKEEKTPAKKEEKTPAKTPSKSAGAKKGMDEIKSLLLKSPNLPKKFDKFANYMKNNMKVTDKKTQQEVWDFVQKNRK